MVIFQLNKGWLLLRIKFSTVTKKKNQVSMQIIKEIKSKYFLCY